MKIQTIHNRHEAGQSQVTLQAEPDDIEAMVGGCAWLSVIEGQTVRIPRYKQLPEQIEDEQILPFFNGCGLSYKYIDFNYGHNWSPSFIISHLCGYEYTPGRYDKEAEKLQSYGFVCMRSKRNDDGKYWEQWVLHGYWSAQGDLKVFFDTYVKKLDTDAEKISTTVSWFCKNCSFGTLDVSAQKAAMTID